MVEQLAPKCLYCNRSTWDPSQKCVDHKHLTSAPTGNPQYQDQAKVPMGSSQEIDATTKAIVRDVAASFPEISQDISLQSIRGAGAQALRDSVSVEVFRVFPYSNVPDPAQRQERLEYIREALVENSKLQPVSINADDAIGLRDSSIDNYGMGHEEGVGLASYAVASEWKLARQIGETVDENGIPYSLDLPEFMNRQQPFINLVVEDEYRRQLMNYGRIIETATNNPPVNHSPVVAAWSPNQQEMANLSPEDEAARARAQRNMEAAKIAGSVAFKTGKGIFKLGKWAVGTVANDFSERYSAASDHIDHRSATAAERQEKKDRDLRRKVVNMQYKDLRRRGIR